MYRIPTANYILMRAQLANTFAFHQHLFMEQINHSLPRKRRSKEQIQVLLTEFEKSKSTVRDFCRQHSINTANFHKWKSRYKSIPDSKKQHSGFARLNVVEPPSLLPTLFAEVKGIKIYAPVTASFLKELIA